MNTSNMSAIEQGALRFLVSKSVLLRNERLDEILAGWNGSITRHVEPEHLPDIILGISTPSLFATGQELHVVVASAPYIKKYSGLLLELLEGGAQNGALILVTTAMDGRDELTKKLKKAEAYEDFPEPNPRQAAEIFARRFEEAGYRLVRSRQVMQAIMEYRACETDTIATTIEQLDCLSGDEPIAPEHVHQLLGGSAERPIYEFTSAFVKGNAKRCLQLLYSGQGLHPEPLLVAIENELRKLISCLETDDDQEVLRRAGSRSRSVRGLHYARKDAIGLGRRVLHRLLNGVLETHVRMRQSGTDPQQSIETLIVRAQRLIRSS